MTAEPNGHENAPALITLAYSRSARIVAIPGGEKYRQAHTTLQAAGFQHRANGTYVLPLAETADTAASMADLIRLAQAQGTTVTTSSRPYIGDIGQDIATHLPGTWSASVDVYSHPVWQTDLEPWLWDTGELSHAVRTSRIPYAALLKDGQGTELLLAERPGHASGYLVGAFVPEAFEGNAKDPNAPRSIVLPGPPIVAARAIVDQFLPAYHQADYDRRITEMAAALDQTSREHAEWQSMAESGRYSDATPMDPDALARTTSLFRDRAWSKFRDFLLHGPVLLDRCEPTATEWPRDAAALDRLRIALVKGDAVSTDWNTLLATLRETPASLPAQSYDEAKRARNDRAWPAIETWLTDGEALIRQAQAAAPRPPAATLSLTRPRPALPPGPGASRGR